jgi:glycosyltransferase involved in cell wall biosynthesis
MQSRQVDEIIIVEDGPLSDQHHAVLEAPTSQIPVLREVLSVNRGAGVANQVGLLLCSGSWVLKVDGDDISLPRRLERELAHAAMTGADVVGSTMLEFCDTEENVISVRKPPLSHAEIVRRMRWNNPMNHPTALYRRSLAVESGGYDGDLRFMQDYDLFARMLSHGATFANIAEPLVLYRTGDAMFARRRSPEMRRCEWRLQKNLQQYGVIGPLRRFGNFAVRQGARTLPPGAMAAIHRRLFSQRPETGRSE